MLPQQALGVDVSGMPMCKGRAETTNESQGMHDLESRAEILSLLLHEPWIYTSNTDFINSLPVGYLNRQQPIQDRPALAAVGFVGVCM